MAIRNRIKPGDYLMVDDLSGTAHYASEMVRQWDGAWVHPRHFETRNPQEFVRACKESQPSVIRAEEPTTAASNLLPLYIGLTTILTPTNGAASHLYNIGIGAMVIGTSFRVR